MAARESTTAKMLSIFKNSTLGLTDDELARHLDGVSRDSLKSIRSRFVKAGELYNDGTTRPGSSGRLLTVYRHVNFSGKKQGRRQVKKAPEPSRSDKIRDAIAGLLAIIQLIETQLPKKPRRKS